MVIEKMKLVSIADILTMSNGACGILAILSFIWYYPDITIGTGLIFLGIVFDGMDGAAARRFGTKHDFGRHLDSISDSFTFCLAPAVLVVAVFYSVPEGGAFLSASALTDPKNILVLLTSMLVVIFGIRRLVIFTQAGYKLKIFLGLATPALAFYIMVISHILDPHRPENESQILFYFSIISILCGSLLMGAKVQYPKIRSKLGVVLAVAIIFSILSIQVQKWFNLGSYDDIFIYYRAISFFGLGIVIVYVFISPIIVFIQNNKKN